MQAACSIRCAQGIAEAKRAKATKQAVSQDKRETRAKLETFKGLPEFKKEAQVAFNKFIRARDADKPCICCGKPLGAGEVGGSYDCGHYRSVGSAPHLRFDERNAHAQRKICNRWGAGRAVDYRLGLIARIGLEAVESLEADQDPRKYTIDDLKEIKKKYTAKAREIAKRNGW